MSKVKLATIWLDGCSGCHMSLLDLDEGILGVAQLATLVYSPLVDAQEFPEGVDVTLVEGAVSSQEDAHRLRTVRARSRFVVALGDCAVTGNVPAMRNTVPVSKILQRVYIEGADTSPVIPSAGVPPLLPQARPLHEFVKIDIHLPGCPPKPEAILGVVSNLIAGRVTKPAEVKFG
jgi:NAD-reducing hydrogenase small subunit